MIPPDKTHRWDLCGCGRWKRQESTRCRPCHWAPTIEHQRARFLRHVDQGTDPDGCWVWMRTRRSGLYGSAFMYAAGRTIPAPRAAWTLFVGAIPDGLFVCHTCDNPPCVRLDHLWLGTHADNMADMAAKGRASSRRNPKQSDDDIRAIRAARSAGRTLADIAAEYGTVQSTICEIVKGKRYRWVAA